MKLQISVTPWYVTSAWFCNLFGISGITFLLLVLQYSSDTSDRFKRHERIHSNQQTFLFLLGLLSCAGTSLVLGILYVVTPWWVWTFPASIPLLLYVVVWAIEVLLPPYDRAYLDSCFEREAYANDADPSYVPTIFSVWNYILKDRR